MIEREPADRVRELEALRQAMMRTWWRICLALWLSVGTLSLWWLRAELRELREYFTWAAVRAMIIFNRPAAVGLTLCVGLTIALLYAESRHILWGLSRGEKSRLSAQLNKIRAQGSSHPQWKIISSTEVQLKDMSCSALDLDVKRRLCELLETGIQAQGAQDFVKFFSAFDSFELEYGSYRGNQEAWVHYTRDFVDSWIDASNHGWQYHEPVHEGDWVPLAKDILESVRENREFSPLLLRGVRLDTV